MAGRQFNRERLGKGPDHFLYRPPNNRDVDVHSLRTARLYERVHAQPLERLLQDQSALTHLGEGGAASGIEVEMHIVGTVDVVALRVPLIQVDASEVDHPQQ